MDRDLPTSMMWNPVRVVSDTLLAPIHTDHSRPRFECPAAGGPAIEVQLVFICELIERSE